MFVATAVFSIGALPERPQSVSWPLLALAAAVLAPITQLLTATEYRETAQLTGVTVGLAESLKISVASSAANLLPLPGSFLVRSSALKVAGADGKAALAAPLSVGLAWIGVGGLLAGAWLTATEPTAFAGACLVVGLAALVLSIGAVARSTTPGALRRLPRIWTIEAAMTLLAACRYFIIAQAIGFTVSIGQGLAIELSSIIATAIGIVPGGLGVRELLAGGIATLVSISASVGITIAVLNRVADMVGLIISSVALFVLDFGAASAK